MKFNILKLALILPVLAMFMTSCEYKIKGYEGEAGIYFDMDTEDTVRFSWVTTPGEIHEKKLPIRITTLGRTTNYDRPFELEIVEQRNSEEQALPNVDYLPFSLNGVIPANQSAVVLEITLLRNPDYIIDDATKVLTIHLKENEHFKFLFDRFFDDELVVNPGDTIEYVRHIDIHRSIRLNEKARRQVWWSYSNEIHPYFGVWSAKKSLLICDLYELNREAWLSGNFDDKITASYIKFMGRDMVLYLRDEAAAGRTVYEVDGVTPMEMGVEAYK